MMQDTWRQKKYKKWLRKISHDHLPDCVHADQKTTKSHLQKSRKRVKLSHYVQTSQGEESPKGSDKWEHKRQRTA